jgi:nicotinamide phosphoribosyltransferase
MINPIMLIDMYKTDHRRQYPDGTTLVYSNFTPRKSRIPGINEVLFFGMQYIILKFLIEDFSLWFERDKEYVVKEYKRRMDNALGKDAVPVDHIEALHDLQYLPLEIKAVPEGTLVPIGVPVFTIKNTRPEFFWLVNYLESALSNKMWKPITSATIALQYRKLFEVLYEHTVGDIPPNGISPVMWQGHDFSYRGMSGTEDAVTSGAGHLLSFYGTDTVAAIDFLEEYYGADSDKEIVGGSVPATEHSVMCMGSKEGELETFRRLICDLYPSGIVSIVSDTWDYWQVITEFLPTLKVDIISRDGKVVIRPDSGDPYRIICGYFPEEYIETDGSFYLKNSDGSINMKMKLTEAEIKGTIQCMWDVFGGTTTARGYKILNDSIGLIYGDSITLQRQQLILQGLMRKGFASTNVVLGIGSFTYEYQTRDTFGFAMKATYGEIEEQDDYGYGTGIVTGREIFKDPKTDDGTKKSAKGLLCVMRNEDGNIVLKDQCTWEEEQGGLLETVFLDGKLTKFTTLSEIRNRVNSQL